MTAQAVSGLSFTPILGRVRAWQFIALGLTGWITLYSSAMLNFQRGIAEMAGHAQGFCFAAAMALGGAETRNQRRKRSLQNALAWTSRTPDWQFEEQLYLLYKQREYRLEGVSSQERQLGFRFRIVHDGRTSLVHSACWCHNSVDEQQLIKLSEGGFIGMKPDRLVLLTKANVSEPTCGRLRAQGWQVISGSDFIAFTRDLPMFAVGTSAESQKRA